jgi:SET domain
MLDIQSKYLFLGLSSGRGRGLFAATEISPGLILGITPSWELTPIDIAGMTNTSIEGYWFDHPNRPGWGILPLGIAALVNHSNKPNSILEWHNSNEGYYGKLRSIDKIYQGFEIFIDYNIVPPNDWI